MPSIAVLPEDEIAEHKMNGHIPDTKPHPGHVNVDPKLVWPHQWNALHLMAFSMKSNHFQDAKGAPNETRRLEVQKYFDGYGYSMLCIKCRVHYHKYIVEHPLDFEDLFKWTIDYHNDVNRIQNKPIFTLQQAHDHYANMLVINKDEINDLTQRFAKFGIHRFPIEQTMAEAHDEIKRLEDEAGGDHGGEVVTSQVTDSESSQISATLIIVCIMAVVVLGAGGVYAYRKYKSRVKNGGEDQEV